MVRMPIFGVLLLVLLFSLTANSANLSSILQRIDSAQKEIARANQFHFLIKDKPLKMHQSVEIKQCLITIKTFSKDGLIFRDTYDLIKHAPIKYIRRVKGSFPLAIGLKAIAHRRSMLYFNSRIKRHRSFLRLKRVHSLCRKFIARKVIRKRREKTARTINFKFEIPTSRGETAGRVQGPDQENYGAVMYGELAYKERYISLLNAKKTIYLQYLTFRGDEAGKFMARLLIEKKQAGLDVRVIIDSFSTLDTREGKVALANTLTMYDNLLAAGIRVFGYSCRRKRFVNEVRGFDIVKLLRRDHEKIWAIDGVLNSPSRVGITGGINFGQEYFRLAPSGKHKWRDQDTILKGPVVGDLHQAFLRKFTEKEIRYKTHRLDKFCFNPHNPIQAPGKYSRFLKSHYKQYKKPKKEELKTANYVKAKIRRVLASDISANLVKLNATRFIHTRPDEKEDYIYKAYIDLINNAKEEVLISNAYFIPQPALRKAIIKASKRGVKIKIISNHPKNNDLAMMNIVGRYFYKDLIYPSIKNGISNVEIYEWIGVKAGSNIMTERTIHTKYMIVDSKISLVGSYNLDGSSRRNAETAIIFNSSEATAELKRFYNDSITYCLKPSLKKIASYKKPKASYWIQLRLGLIIKDLL